MLFRSPATRRAWVIDVAGAASSGAFAWLAWRSNQREALPVGELFLVMACGWIALLVAWRAALGVAGDWIARRMWRWALVLRLVGFVAQPVLEDDHWRFLWDGQPLRRSADGAFR